MPLPLAMDQRVRIVGALAEGNSIRATARMVGVNKDTVMGVGMRVGEGCARLHDRIARNLAVHMLECDEQWSYVHTKASRVKETDPSEWGDAYTYIGLDAVSKLVVSWHVGKRDDENTRLFINDLRARLTVVPHLSTDGWVPYIDAVRDAFKGAVDYGRVIKNAKGEARRESDPFDKYEPARDIFMTLEAVSGAPDMDMVSTSFVERFNGTMRHMVGRKRRRCLAFSKTLRGHRAAIGLCVATYNLIRVHGTLGTTPAVASGVVERPWSLPDLVAAALDEPETEAPKAKPLAPRPGAVAPERQTSTGRVLRLVHGGSTQAPTPAPEVTAAPVGPVQLGLFDPRPVAPKPPRPMEQMRLFPEDT